MTQNEYSSQQTICKSLIGPIMQPHKGINPIIYKRQHRHKKNKALIESVP